MASLLSQFPTLAKSIVTQQKAGSKLGTNAKKPAASAGAAPVKTVKKPLAVKTNNKIGDALAAKFGGDLFGDKTKKKKKRVEKEAGPVEAEKPEAQEAVRDVFKEWDEQNADDNSDDDQNDEFDDDMDLMEIAKTGGLGEDKDSDDDQEEAEDEDEDDMELDSLLATLSKGGPKNTEESSKLAHSTSATSTNPISKKKAAAARKVVNSTNAVVAVHNANAGKRDPSMLGGAKEWRHFMTSDVTKMLTEPKVKEGLTKEEEEQDKQDDAHDRELMSLLETSKLIEQVTSEDLFGKDRRKYMESKMIELGAKKGPNEKMPFPMRLFHIKNTEKKMEQRLEKAKELGVYHKSLKTQIMAGGDRETALKITSGKKKKGSGRGQPKALDGGAGHFRNGTLHVGKSAMDAIGKLGKKKGGGNGLGIKITGVPGGGGGKAGKKKKGGKKFKKR